MYPLKLKKCFIEKIWGGRAFEKSLEMKLPTDSNYGESWEVSTHLNGLSYVENGILEKKSILELINNDPIGFLGEEITKKFKGKFPLLIKYLDINDKLSVQVHPNDEYALKVEKEFGKSEAWYVIEASENAKLIMGIKEEISKEEFIKKIKQKDFKNLFNIISVKKGDCININPGLVHASLEGSVFIYEVQQNSDITYRIYDFDRLINGKKRELQLDKAIDVINFTKKLEITSYESREKIHLNNAIKEELIKGNYFNLEKYLINGEFKDKKSSTFKIYSIINGKGTIISNGIKYCIEKGDTYFIPAKLEIIINGKVEILKSFV